MQLVAIIGKADPLPKGVGSAVLVQVLDVDPKLFGKAFQIGTTDIIDITGSLDVIGIIQSAYPDAQIFNSSKEMGDKVQGLLVTEGLREVDPNTGKIVLSAEAVAIDAGEVIP